jgi:hypothetical protein
MGRVEYIVTISSIFFKKVLLRIDLYIGAFWTCQFATTIAASRKGKILKMIQGRMTLPLKKSPPGTSQSETVPIENGPLAGDGQEILSIPPQYKRISPVDEPSVFKGTKKSSARYSISIIIAKDRETLRPSPTLVTRYIPF